MEKPRTRYARSGDVFVAYQAFGEGPFDLVVIPGFLSNIEYGWEFESWRNYYGGLASFARVLLFDKRGTGISDPVPRAPSIEERMDDVRAVMDAAGSERAAVIGSGDGAAIAAVFAVFRASLERSSSARSFHACARETRSICVNRRGLRRRRVETRPRTCPTP